MYYLKGVKTPKSERFGDINRDRSTFFFLFFCFSGGQPSHNTNSQPKMLTVSTKKIKKEIKTKMSKKQQTNKKKDIKLLKNTFTGNSIQNKYGCG